MFVSNNFAVIKCLECGEVIKIEPQRPFDLAEHKCNKREIKIEAPIVSEPKPKAKAKKEK